MSATPPLPIDHALHGYVPVASPVTLPRYDALACDPLDSVVTGALNSLFLGDSVNSHMTVDTLAPAAPHTTATDITASAPMLHTLLNAALSCGTQRAYRRTISSHANLCRFGIVLVICTLITGAIFLDLNRYNHFTT